MTHQSSKILRRGDNVDLPFLIGQFGYVDRWRAHGSIIGFRILRIELVFGDHGCFGVPDGFDDACKQFFLSMQRFVPLSFTELFQPILDNNLVLSF